MKRHISVLIISFAVVSCITTSKPKTTTVFEAEEFCNDCLQDMALLSPDFTWQQRLEVEFAGDTHTLPVILQKVDDKLTVIGFTPFGSRAFVLTQQGIKFSFETYLKQELPFHPGAILIDIHKVYFLGLTEIWNNNNQVPEGDNNWELQDRYSVSDHWENGMLKQRTIVDSYSRKVDIEYQGGYLPGLTSPPVRLVNHFFGYTLQVATTGD